MQLTAPNIDKDPARYTTLDVFILHPLHRLVALNIVQTYSIRTVNDKENRQTPPYEWTIKPGERLVPVKVSKPTKNNNAC